MSEPTANDDSFELWDLRVEVVAPAGATLYCSAKPGDWFELKGEVLHLPPGQGFSIYSLAALLPLLPAKQRTTHPNDWMSTDAEVALPRSQLPFAFSHHRTGKRTFRHGATTAVSLARKDA
ncbi:MAG: TIGR04076 family protein [Rhodospirillales bacterium]